MWQEPPSSLLHNAEESAEADESAEAQLSAEAQGPAEPQGLNPTDAGPCCPLQTTANNPMEWLVACVDEWQTETGAAWNGVAHTAATLKQCCDADRDGRASELEIEECAPKCLRVPRGVVSCHWPM